jgi:hypothetical protein
VTGTWPCSTQGCGYQSGDPSGQCWQCRAVQPGYLAQLRQKVETGMAAEYAAHPGWREAAQASQAETEAQGPSPFRFFHADVIRKECPECGWATAVGFDSPHDPGAQDRQPAKCLECSAADIHHAAIQEAKTPVESGAGPAPGECDSSSLDRAMAALEAAGLIEPEAGP